MRWIKSGGIAAALPLLLLLSGCAGNKIPVNATPDDILTRAEKELADGDEYHASEALDYFVRSFPGNSKMPLVQLRLGDAHFGMEEYVVARGHYERVVDDYPGSPYVEEARFKIAKCAYESAYPHDRDQTETQQAIDLFTDFKRDYPDSRFLPEVEKDMADCRDRIAHGEFDAGRFYEDRNRKRSAKIQYEYVLDQYPDTEWAPKACFRLGELYRSRERWEDARRYYGRVIRDWPASQEAGEARTLLKNDEFAHVDEKGGGK